jgi:hypothetical protein
MIFSLTRLESTSMVVPFQEKASLQEIRRQVAFAWGIFSWMPLEPSGSKNPDSRRLGKRNRPVRVEVDWSIVAGV